MSRMDKYEEIKCFDGSDCEYKKCPLYNFNTDKCKLESLKAPRVPVGQQPQRQEEPTSVEFTVGKYVDVTGSLLNRPESKEGTRQDGTEWRMAKFDLQLDDTIVSVALWDDFSETGLRWVEGDKVFLKGMKVNKPYEGKTQLGTARYSEIKKLD